MTETPDRQVVKLTFDRETCDRCGGTGRMPFAAYGGVCLKCHGKGSSLTRRGRAASDRMVEWQNANLNVRVDQLEVGDSVRMTSLGGKSYTAKVVEVVPSDVTMTTKRDDVETVHPLYRITFDRGPGLTAPAETRLGRTWTRETLTRCYLEVLSRMSGVVPTWSD